MNYFSKSDKKKQIEGEHQMKKMKFRAVRPSGFDEYRSVVTFRLAFTAILTLIVFGQPLKAQNVRINTFTVEPMVVVGGQNVNVRVTMNRPSVAIIVAESLKPQVIPFIGPWPTQNRPILTKTVTTSEVSTYQIARVGVSLGRQGRSLDVIVNPKPPATAPSLSSPANYAVNYGTSQTLSWSSVPGATSYEVCVKKEGDNTGCNLPLTTNNPLTSTSRSTSLSGFRGKLVYWKVRACKGWKGSSKGPWSARRSIRVTLPSARLTSPARNANVNTLRPQFRWQPVEDAHSYQIEVTGPNNQKQTYTIYKRSTAFNQRRFTPPANKQLPFVGKCTWSVNARSFSVTAFGQPRPQPGLDQIRSMTIPVRALKKR